MTDARAPSAPGTGLALLLGAVLIAAGLATRPLMPIDETRYLAVAWEMHHTGDWLVPHINGAPYSHKPPLLFWLINAAWLATGVAEWSARLVAPLCGLACVGLVWRMAQTLWPDRSQTAAGAALILATMSLWGVFASLTMFDTLLTCTTLVALHGVLMAARGGRGWGWLLFGVAIGLGLLAKGPVCLVHALPAAILAPWWAASLSGRWRWYGGLLAATLFGVAIVLAWAIPAARAGGEEYRNAILWGQTMGRVMHSFAHRREWWWYLPLLPALALPWTGCVSFWQGLRSHGLDGGTRFCLAWLMPGIVLLSLVSGKQVHYLLPLLPPIALIVSAVLTRTPVAPSSLSLRVLGLGTVAGGVALLLSPFWLTGPGMEGVILCSPWCGLVWLILGGWLAWRRFSSSLGAIQAVAAVSAINLSAALWGLMPGLFARYDLAPLSAQIATLQARGVPILHEGDYDGQYAFAGRLRQPLDIARSPEERDAWLKQHPAGYILSYTPPAAVFPMSGAEFAQPYVRDVKQKWVGLWRAITFAHALRNQVNLADQNQASPALK